jgi:redox-regulated HSP33 family molecular chaperone
MPLPDGELAAGIPAGFHRLRESGGLMSAQGDHLVRGLGLEGRVRAVATDTTAVARELRRIHQPTRTVTTALGRLATGALLLAGSLEKVTRREPVLTCEFCRTPYEVSASELRSVLEGIVADRLRSGVN